MGVSIVVAIVYIVDQPSRRPALQHPRPADRAPVSTGRRPSARRRPPPGQLDPGRRSSLTRKDRAALRPAVAPAARAHRQHHHRSPGSVIAIFAPELAPYPPNLQFGPLTAAPSHLYLFGTDELGRDVFSRVLYGARLSLPLAVLLVAVAMIDRLDPRRRRRVLRPGSSTAVIMRIADLVFAFPGIILAMAVAAALGAQLRNAVLAVIVVSWPSYCPLSRGLVLGGSLLGVRDLRPAPRLVGLAHDVGRAPAQHRRPDPRARRARYRQRGAAAVRAVVPRPRAQPPTAEWGSMVSEGAQNFNSWWIGLFPGLAILTVVLAFNFLGDACATCSTPGRPG